MQHPTSCSRLSRCEALSLAAGLTILAMILNDNLLLALIYERHFDHISWLTNWRFLDAITILVGLMLTLPAPRANGLCIGSIRQHWKAVLFVIGGPLLITILVYPRLPERPFAGSDLSLWLTSPLAQDLFFGGIIYRLLRPHFSGRVCRWLPFEWVLPVGGLFFAGWHLQNFAFFPVWYVCLQLLYTWAAYTFVGLTRQWTGSILYVVIGHMAGNFVAWYVD